MRKVALDGEFVRRSVDPGNGNVSRRLGSACGVWKLPARRVGVDREGADAVASRAAVCHAIIDRLRACLLVSGCARRH